MDKPRGMGFLKPTPRLIVFAVLSTLITLRSDWPSVIVALVIGLGLLIAGGKYPRPGLLACLSAFALTFVGHAVTAAEPTATFLIFKLSPDSVLKGLRLGLRLAAMILPAIAFIAVTPLPELLEAFRGLRIPAAAEMYLTIVLRYVDILWYDIEISMKAMAVRGVNWEGGFREKIPAFRRLMLPLIFRILDHVDGQSLAIDNRGGVLASREAQPLAEDAPALVMRDVHVLYGGRGAAVAEHAVSALDLTIAQGEAAVLLGRIGAGKTTTLLLCTGLIPKSLGRMRGDVTLFGHNTKEASLSQMGRLARIVFPSAVQGLVGLSVRDELAFSLRTSPEEPAAYPELMADALRLVGLDESFLDRQTLNLSGGEMQRVALASAIVARPRLLALDDVTVQLDPVGKREVVAALQTMLEGRMTTVMTDPHVELLAQAGDRFIALEAGRIVGDGAALDGAALERASLRVPQMWRLGRALGRALPVRLEEALPLLRDAVQTPPDFAVSPGPEGEPGIRATGLTYQYENGPVAVRGVDVAFWPGEFVTILGSNGSGKTTMALALAGALEPTAGGVTIDGEPFTPARHRGQIGYVFQEPVNQIVTMKVRDELAFGPQQLGWDEAAVAGAVARELARFDLDPEAVPLSLSPAAARKLAIAATLTMQPRLIILDEPTNNLDEAEVSALMAHLRALRAGGTAVVLITHDVEVACDHADRVIVMSRGEILADGPTRTIMAERVLLRQSDVVVPPVVEASLALWPERLPALTVAELAPAFAPVEA